jgi:hypothetical protein
LIHDYGQGGAFIGGNRFSDSDNLVSTINSEFFAHKAANFVPNRLGYFHYFLMPHSTGTGGYGEIVGDDVLFSTQACLADIVRMSGVLMHELGHNLGLFHGGNDGFNYKPNYNSVMNYAYQFPGVDTNCTPPGDGLLDYSHGDRAPLVESALSESIGICNNVSWDWNGNGFIDGGLVQFDINFDSTNTSTLRDHDDWSAIVYDWDGTFSGSGVAMFSQYPAVSSCDNPAPMP